MNPKVNFTGVHIKIKYWNLPQTRLISIGSQPEKVVVDVVVVVVIDFVLLLLLLSMLAQETKI